MINNLIIKLKKKIYKKKQLNNVGFVESSVQKPETVVIDVKGDNISEEKKSDSSGYSRRSMNIQIAEDNLIKSLYNFIPRYDRDGDIHKLLDFVDKVELYFEVAELIPTRELMAVIAKLTGTAGLLWRHHKKKYPDKESSGRIKIWSQLKDMLLRNKIINEQERYILTHLEVI